MITSAVLWLFQRALICAIVLINFGNSEIIVKLENGNVQGSEMTSEHGSKFFAFQGIPYAEPPVGDLRFKPPLKKKPWNQDPLDATKKGPVCPQIDVVSHQFIGEDDCLIVNVYTPELPQNQEHKKRSVMVFVHGGAFQFGSGNSDAEGPLRMMNNDIILVLMNYRLGPLGFLSTGDSALPGNYGLLDQNEALRWVKDNIEAFGGDSDSITIFGQSAGSGGIGFHVLSPLSAGLYNRAISLSGSPLCIWAVAEDPLYWAQKVGSSVGCSSDDSNKLADCLQQASSKDLTAAGGKIIGGFNSKTIFVPVIDDYFLPDSPNNLYTTGKFNRNISFLTGITEEEGAFFASAFFKNRKTDGPFTKEEVHQVVEDLTANAGSYNADVIDLLEKEYFSKVNLSNLDEVKNVVIKFHSQGMFRECTYRTALSVAKAGVPTYVYNYDYNAGVSVSQQFGEKDLWGIGHGDDLYMLFSGAMYDNLPKTAENLAMEKKFQSLLINFAKYGNPTPEQSSSTWKAVKSDDRDSVPFYRIDEPDMMEQYPLKEDNRYYLWMKEVPETIENSKNKSKHH